MLHEADHPDAFSDLLFTFVLIRRGGPGAVMRDRRIMARAPAWLTNGRLVDSRGRGYGEMKAEEQRRFRITYYN